MSGDSMQSLKLKVGVAAACVRENLADLRHRKSPGLAGAWRDLLPDLRRHGIGVAAGFWSAALCAQARAAIHEFIEQRPESVNLVDGCDSRIWCRSHFPPPIGEF